MDRIIETLEDVLPHIVPDTGIFHFDYDGYSVINYVYTLDNTFDSAVARECRGLKFDLDGRLIARPFHKFFNLGEKRPVQEEPWDAAHAILDKLDTGSWRGKIGASRPFDHGLLPLVRSRSMPRSCHFGPGASSCFHTPRSKLHSARKPSPIILGPTTRLNG